MTDQVEVNTEKPKIKTKMDHLKNPLFIKNSKDPVNGQFVKSIWLLKNMKEIKYKKNRITQVYQYFL